jgi:N-acetylglucosamine-6-sulfatase
MGRVTASRPRPRHQIRSTVLAVVAVCLLGAGCGPLTGVVQTQERPNVILILTDDLDARLLEEHPASYPSLRSLAAGGTTFENAFVTDSLCCPSRATILRGQYAHNHGVLGNWWPRGGSRKFHDLGREGSTVATWLQDEGYRTVLIGKYMNGYEGTRVPPGWDEWYAVSGDYRSTRLSENGEINAYDDLRRHHLDDVLAEKAASYLRRAAGDDPPFFMWLGTQAPHAPATSAPRHDDAFANASLPRPPSFDEENVSDKPDWISDNPTLDRHWVASMEDLYQKRLQSMLAVDEMIGELVESLDHSGELDNTYILFTSDNGYHMGTHRLSTGKWTAYEEDIRVPLIVRGPGVAEGRKLAHLVLNNDLAPTMADLGGVEAPSFVDGRSLKPLLDGDPPPPENWRRAFLVEAFPELAGTPSLADETTPRLLTGDPWPYEDARRSSLLERPSLDDAGRPGFQAVRTEDHLYVEYETRESELYDLEKDPYELNNVYKETELEHLWRLERWLDALRECVAEECRAVEDGAY